MDYKALSLLLAMTGCNEYLDDTLDDLFPDSTTDGPIGASLALGAGLDPAKIRAGIFHRMGPAEVELARGETVDANAEIDILVSLEGKAKLQGAWDAERNYDVEDLAAVRFTPLFPAAVSEQTITVDLPEDPMPGDYFVFVVWYDDDGDGRLELSRTGDSEFARSLARSFPADRQDELYLMDIESWPPDPDEPVTWKVSAGGGDGSEEKPYVTNDISDRELGEWSVRIDAARQ